MDKKEIRSLIRTTKKTIGADILLKQSSPLAVTLAENIHFRSADKVMLYYPLWDEPDTRPSFDVVFRQKKRLILPTVVGDDIIPVEVTPDTQWIEGSFGIMEPQAEPYREDIDFILVPGVAFDQKLNRLGRGKGYYDRFLALHSNAYRLGVCFDFQMVSQLPLEPHDLPMNDIIILKTCSTDSPI